MKVSKFPFLCLVPTLLILASLAFGQDRKDSLYIGNYSATSIAPGDNSVLRFDAATGADEGVFATPPTITLTNGFGYTGPDHPNGMVFDHPDHVLLVNFQNLCCPIPQ